jgi:hypothetical protein
MTILPTPFLFRFLVPVQRQDKLPRSKAPVLSLPENCRIPFPSALDAGPHFARLALAWNPQGLCVEVRVTGKHAQPYCVPEAISASDSISIWIDTRDTQTQHRGSRFCHYFVAMPCGGGDEGQLPFVRQLPVPRAREDAPEADPESLLAEAEPHDDGYRLAVWLPADALHGFDPASQNRLGFYLTVHDTQLGKQVLTVGEEFPYESDPSQWISLELV